jgi:hypothetical protein
VLLPAAVFDAALTPLFYLPLRWVTTLTADQTRLRMVG